MSSAAATILAAVISAAISFTIAGVSYISAKNGARGAVQARIHELTQIQITEILHQRMECYPSLWELCQKGISMPYLMGYLPDAGWEADLSKALESWHAEHGVFLSEDCYRGLWHLRKLARIFSSESTAEDSSLAPRTLDAIWSHGFTDNDGTSRPGLSVLLKNDLGSYGRAALSISDRMSKRIGTTSDGFPVN